MPTRVPGGVPSGIHARFWVFGLSSVTLQDVISVMSNKHERFNSHWGIALTRVPQNGPVKGRSTLDPVVNNKATRLTSVRGTQGDTFHSDWSISGVSAGDCIAGAADNDCGEGTTSAVQSPWQDTSTTGARLCYRWGTTTPLWPWPMNERIKAATTSAGSYRGPCPTCVGGRAARIATDVTAEIEKLLGTIPGHCKNS